MRLTFSNFGPVVLDDLHAQVAALGIAGFTGLSYDGSLHIEIPGAESVTAEQHAAIQEAVAAYVYTPPADGG